MLSICSQEGAKDGMHKEQAFHPDLTATFNKLHVPPRFPTGV
ncbi:MAG: hypothetical protein N2235_21525 [Fischerella sp.]|nr:hypothetical protein [Fischerella sp.]